MNRLIIRYAGYSANKALVTVDGQKLKYDKNGTCAFETQKSAVTVRVFNVLEASRRTYYLWSLLYFFISFFGIFDSYRDYSCRTVDAEFIVRISGETRLTIRNRAFNKKGESEAVTVECDGDYETVRNVQRVDVAAKRRTRIMTAVRIVLFIGVIALVAAVASML